MFSGDLVCNQLGVFENTPMWLAQEPFCDFLLRTVGQTQYGCGSLDSAHLHVDVAQYHLRAKIVRF